MWFGRGFEPSEKLAEAVRRQFEPIRQAQLRLRESLEPTRKMGDLVLHATERIRQAEARLSKALRPIQEMQAALDLLEDLIANGFVPGGEGFTRVLTGRVGVYLLHPD